MNGLGELLKKEEKKKKTKVLKKFLKEWERSRRSNVMRVRDAVYVRDPQPSVYDLCTHRYISTL